MNDKITDDNIRQIGDEFERRKTKELNIGGVNLGAIANAIIIAVLLGLWSKLDKNTTSNVIQKEQINEIAKDVVDINRRLNLVGAKLEAFTVKPRYSSDEAEADLLPIKQALQGLDVKIEHFYLELEKMKTSQTELQIRLAAAQ